MGVPIFSSKSQRLGSLVCVLSFTASPLKMATCRRAVASSCSFSVTSLQVGGRGASSRRWVLSCSVESFAENLYEPMTVLEWDVEWTQANSQNVRLSLVQLHTHVTHHSLAPAQRSVTPQQKNTVQS